MLTSVDVTNYRGFTSYRMDELARVNLLVGKNNSGKTAILEGLQYFASGGDPAVLADIAERRGETIDGREKEGTLSDVGQLFHGRELFPGACFRFSQGDRRSVTTSIDADVNGRVDDSTSLDVRTVGLQIKYRADNLRQERRISLAEDGTIPLHRLRQRPLSLAKVRSVHHDFIAPEALDYTDLAIRWDRVTLAGQDGEVVDAMRMLCPSLQSVHFLLGATTKRRRGGIVVGVREQEARMPLGSFGDGMRRMLGLATALVGVKDGSLFIDEIDSGLHYSVLADMWKLVIKRALAADVQVFAATHSWDCIDAMAAACVLDPELVGQVAVHKIDPALPHSVPFAKDAVLRLAKYDIDPR